MQMVLAKISEPRWTAPLVALLLVGMLLTFYAVVSSATKAGEMRRQATATHAAQVMQCQALPSGTATRNCLKSLEEDAEDSVQVATAK